MTTEFKVIERHPLTYEANEPLSEQRYLKISDAANLIGCPKQDFYEAFWQKRLPRYRDTHRDSVLRVDIEEAKRVLRPRAKAPYKPKGKQSRVSDGATGLKVWLRDRFFHTRDAAGLIERQGEIVNPMDDAVVVRFFSFLDGVPTRTTVYSYSQILEEHWSFYASAEDMRETYEEHVKAKGFAV